ncbi:hypothetical protein GWI33_011885 [Rhynchophorus ferrugineus]|uniref:Uncharacterized protein n=1 Tax=Rhynchophorus ferrugineus TaxID=354439 RepID=A0A834I7A6_RHYFE|nr:hypothetical protein GWI33_011885 [Rhynchophorus ferrugineus]
MEFNKRTRFQPRDIKTHVRHNYLSRSPDSPPPPPLNPLSLWRWAIDQSKRDPGKPSLVAVATVRDIRLSLRRSRGPDGRSEPAGRHSRVFEIKEGTVMPSPNLDAPTMRSKVLVVFRWFPSTL